jgi:predicted phosphodiesterase
MRKYILLAIIGVGILLIPKSSIQVTDGELYNSTVIATGMHPTVTATNYSLLPKSMTLSIPNFHKDIHFDLGPFETERNEIDPGSMDTFTFAYFGDTQPESGAEQSEIVHTIIERINEGVPLFVIGGGDFVCEASDANFQAFLSAVDQLHSPIFFVCGNHDIMDDPELYERYLGPKQYSFFYNDSLFIILDSSSGFLSDDQLAFFEEVLKRERETTFVFTHIPPFDPRPGGTSALVNGEEFMEIVQKNDVDYVFSSHIHAYYQEERDGTLYVISGGAGAPLLQGGYHHYVMVTVGDEIDIMVRRCGNG